MMRIHFHSLSCLRPLLTAVSLLSCAQATSANDDVRKAIEPLLFENCYECHDDTTSKGSLNLLDLEFEPDKHHNFERWARILERIKTGEMPPPEEGTPLKPEEIASAVKILDAPLLAADLADKKAKGRVNVRRLTRREYEYTMHDLLSIGIPLQVHLPEDPSTHGFETVASGQQFSHFNLAAYLETADLALEAAFSRFSDFEKPYVKNIPVEKLGPAGHRGGNYRGPEIVGDRAVTWPYGLQFFGRLPATTVPESGWYRITLKGVHGVNAPKGVVWGTLSSGKCVSNTHFNLAAYLETADLALEAAFSRFSDFEKPYVKNIPVEKLGPAGHRGGNYRGPEIVGDRAVTWPYGLQFFGRLPATTVPESGWYRITLKGVHGVNAPKGVVWGTLSSGKCVSNTPVMELISIIEATPKRQDLTFEAWISEDHMLEFKPNDASYKRVSKGSKGGNVNFKGTSNLKDGSVGLATTGIRMERIYPEGTREEVKAKLFPGLKSETIGSWKKSNDTNEETVKAMEKTIQRFADRAFRRPVKAEDIQGYFSIAREMATDKDYSTLDGLKAAYRAILCSPRFLTLPENSGKIDDHALASRLSYMLWNSMPDAQLRKIADEGRLSDGKVRHEQAARLLSDPKSERFINAFTDQWLNLKEINFTAPDRRLYKTFDPIVQESMLLETRAFVSDLIASNRNISNLISSDHAMLNERLVRFYQMKTTKVIPGKGLQKVSIKGSPRGGLITQGAVLKVTADGTTTSPVVRGVWMAERILGMEIPPPPPGVPAVEPDIRGAVSIRDQLEKHRNSVDCASCHRKLDPAGFALESFDPVGNWRTKYGTVKNAATVDPSGITPDGKAFEGILQWKNIYTGRRDLLTEGFAKQLITYATGAPPRYSDRDSVQKILVHAREKKYGMKSIVHAVVASEAFLEK